MLPIFDLRLCLRRSKFTGYGLGYVGLPRLLPVGQICGRDAQVLGRWSARIPYGPTTFLRLDRRLQRRRRVCGHLSPTLFERGPLSQVL